jgi:hypothetical protein
MRLLSRTATLLALFAPLPAATQSTRGATIAGTVRDSAAQPIADADIIVQSGRHRTRSDSAGNYVLTGLSGGGYVVAARKVGYAPMRWDVSVSKSGRVEINFVLSRHVQLDTVNVVAVKDCPIHSFDGFMCRRASGRGLFLDDADIDERDALTTADIFRSIPGFRVDTRPTRNGPVWVARTTSYTGCIASLVDGRPVSDANRIPPKPYDLTGIEVYLSPDSVPEPYRRFTWPSRSAHQRCSMVIYWTLWAPLGRLEDHVTPP